MLVTFKTDVGNIIMFGDVALTLIKMMGHSPTVPGAILSEDIPVALNRLKVAVENEKIPASAGDEEDEDEDEYKDKPKVSMANRALPLINLLAAAEKAGSDVMWD